MNVRPNDQRSVDRILGSTALTTQASGRTEMTQPNCWKRTRIAVTLLLTVPVVVNAQRAASAHVAVGVPVHIMTVDGRSAEVAYAGESATALQVRYRCGTGMTSLRDQAISPDDSYSAIEHFIPPRSNPGERRRHGDSRQDADAMMRRSIPLRHAHPCPGYRVSARQ